MTMNYNGRKYECKLEYNFASGMSKIDISHEDEIIIGKIYGLIEDEKMQRLLFIQKIEEVRLRKERKDEIHDLQIQQKI